MSAQSMVLDNGMRLVSYANDHFQSVSIGIFTRVGLVQETEHGMAHFLEHMCFKGTSTLSAEDIASRVDKMGGRINAFTAKEYTCYYLTVLPHFCTEALQLIRDIYVDASLLPDDIHNERGVILEEIHMTHDAPDDWVHDLFYETIWSTNHLGRPILGTPESLNRINHDNLNAFRSHYFVPENCIVSIAGPTSCLSDVESTVMRLFHMPNTVHSSAHSYYETPVTTPLTTLKHRQIEQIHFCLGVKGMRYLSDHHYAMMILSTILGGSMSSRLFQDIREKKGWAYSIYSYATFYQHDGLFVVSGGINKDKFSDTLHCVFDMWESLKTMSCSAAELDKAKQYIKGNFAINLEKSSSWMSFLAKSIMYHDVVQSVTDVYDAIDSVTIDDIQQVSASIFNRQTMALSAIGPFTESVQGVSGQSVEAVLNQI